MSEDRPVNRNAAALRLVGVAVSIAMVAAALALLLLTLLFRELGQPAVQAMDLTLQARVHAATSPVLTREMLACTWIGSIKIFVTALVTVLVWLIARRHRHAAALLGFAITGALLLNESLKLHFHRARPHVPWSIGDESTWSFPSGHSLFSFVLYGTLVYLGTRQSHTAMRRLTLILPAVLLTLNIGLSRIYLGMHFPTDVFAGYLTGALWLLGVIAIDRQWLAWKRRELHAQGARVQPPAALL